MPVTFDPSEMDSLKSAIQSGYPSFSAFSRAIGIDHKALNDFMHGRMSPGRATQVASRVHEVVGIAVAVSPSKPVPRFDKTGVPVFHHSHRALFNQLVRDAGFKSTVKLADAIGLNIQNFSSMFSNHISGDLYRRLHAAVLEAAGIDLTELASCQQVEEVAPGPLDDLHAARWITDAELAAGRALATAANGLDYPGRDPLPCFSRTWSPGLQAAWRALQVADAETDRCRPRLPTASLVAWTVCVFREPLDLRDPCGRDALTSLRLGLQHLEGVPS